MPHDQACGEQGVSHVHDRHVVARERAVHFFTLTHPPPTVVISDIARLEFSPVNSVHSRGYEHSCDEKPPIQKHQEKTQREVDHCIRRLTVKFLNVQEATHVDIQLCCIHEIREKFEIEIIVHVRKENSDFVFLADVFQRLFCDDNRHYFDNAHQEAQHQELTKIVQNVARKFIFVKFFWRHTAGAIFRTTSSERMWDEIERCFRENQHECSKIGGGHHIEIPKG